MVERASRAGIVDAIYCLALHYELGRGTNVDYAQALDLYTRAAEAGSADAQCNLGMMFLNGTGMPSNRVRAVWWFVQAAPRGNETAHANLRWIARNAISLSSAEIEEMRAIERQAEDGELEPLLVFGWMHAVGFGRSVDLDAARKLYEQAQARGHIFAHVLLTQLSAAAN